MIAEEITVLAKRSEGIDIFGIIIFSVVPIDADFGLYVDRF